MANTRMNQPPSSKHGDFMQPQRRRRRFSSVSAPLMFVVVIVAIIFVMSVFFRVKDIQVVGNSHYTNEEIIRAIDIEEGDNLFFFDRFASLSRVFAKLPYIEEVTVTRHLPDRVVIEVTESKALAYLVLGDEYWTLDRNCKVLGKAVLDELSSLIPVEGINPGTLLIGEPMQTEDNDLELVEYLREILFQMQERGLYMNITLVDFSNPDDVYFYYGDRFTVRLGRNSETEYKFGMFVSVLQKLTGGDVGYLDLSDGRSAHFMAE